MGMLVGIGLLMAFIIGVMAGMGLTMWIFCKAIIEEMEEEENEHGS